MDGTDTASSYDAWDAWCKMMSARKNANKGAEMGVASPFSVE